jgi:thiamine-monophosphate kinase
MMSEAARLAAIARVLGTPAAGVEVGIGDDAAVLSTADAEGRIVWTIDEQVEGTHFRRTYASWCDVGWRSFMAAASDLAAMGAKPWCALSALVLPDDVDDAALDQIVVGQRDAAGTVGAPVVGGNLARGPVLSIATTLLGTGNRAIKRAGARPGDRVWLAGAVGHAAAGLRALQAGRAGEASLVGAVHAWRRPRALIDEGRAMAALAHAAIDVSDGLACDAGHLADASGACVVFDEAALRSDDALTMAAAALGADPLDLALYGGEDYAVLAASAEPIAGFRCIGEIAPGSGLILRSRGDDRRIDARGFDHFASRAAR